MTITQNSIHVGGHTNLHSRDSTLAEKRVLIGSSNTTSVRYTIYSHVSGSQEKTAHTLSFEIAEALAHSPLNAISHDQMDQVQLPHIPGF
jgi:hypothetical protein